MAQRQDWQWTEAEVVSCEWSWLRSEYGDYFAGMPARSCYIAEYVYEVNGVTYRQGMHTDRPDQVGECFRLEYDPVNPKRNSVLNRTISLDDPRTWLIWLIGLLAAAILIHFNIW